MRKAWLLSLFLVACAPATKGTLSPLHQAVLADDPPRARALLASGADPGARDVRGRTPLHLAVSRESEACIQLLLAFGADPHLPDREGESPLDYAARYGYKRAFWLLLGK